jgi:hypothetical protein
MAEEIIEDRANFDVNALDGIFFDQRTHERCNGCAGGRHCRTDA